MRKLVPAFVLVALLVIAVVGVVQAEPIGGTGYDDFYYSDSTYTTVVGERYMLCGGGQHGTGVLSAYVITDEWDCSTFEQVHPSCAVWFCNPVNQSYPWDIYHYCSCVEH
jgi:hypothetical protein